MKIRDLSGQKFGRLTVIKWHGFINRKTKWECLCDCGNRSIHNKDALLSGCTRSCGCLLSEYVKSQGTHRMTKSTEFIIWSTMKQRCSNKNHDAYPYYGAIGISVCERWNKFENFLQDMGERPKAMSIERKDRTKNYGPDNCVWATLHDQCRNKKNNIFVDYLGERLCLTDWAKKLNIKFPTIRCRYHKGDRPPYLFRQINFKDAPSS